MIVPIFLGGLLMAWVKSRMKRSAPEQKEAVENRGLLLASGLITGEALMGVLIAVVAVFAPQFLPGEIGIAQILGSVTLIVIVFYLLRSTLAA